MNTTERNMSTEEKSRTPQLRFPGFTGEWVEKSFGDIYRKNNVKNDLSFGVDRIISVANMYYKSDVTISDENYLKSYNVFRIGDIAFEGNRSANFAFGRFVENTIGDGIVSHVFDVYSPISSDHCIEYWKYAINYEKIMRPVLEKCTIKSTMMTNLVSKDFLKQKVLVPPTLAEQQKIAECLSELDALINTQTQKVETLKEKKNGLMQLLFPQNGETTPRLRFPDFTGEWKERKLGESFDERTEKNRGDLPLLSLGENGLAYQRDTARKDNSNKDKSKYLRVVPGDIAYNTMRMWQGRCVCVNIEGIVSPAYTVCKPKKGIDSLFHYYLFKTYRMIQIFHQHSQGLVSDTLNLKYEAFSNISYMLPPSLTEQQEIAECLSALDDRISTETARLDALKDHKKGLMQKLFPEPSK